MTAAAAKNSKRASIPVRADLAAELRAWRAECGTASDTRQVFTVSRTLVHCLKRDLKAAGIDPVGVDVHSLRHTTRSQLRAAGVDSQTAKEIMRHSDIRQTERYDDLRLHDLPGAVEKLPSCTRGPEPEPESQRATGTYDSEPVSSSEKLGAWLGGKERTSVHSGSSLCAVESTDRGGRPQVATC